METCWIKYEAESEHQTNKQSEEKVEKERLQRAHWKYTEAAIQTEPETALSRITHTCYI